MAVHAQRIEQHVLWPRNLSDKRVFPLFNFVIHLLQPLIQEQANDRYFTLGNFMQANPQITWPQVFPTRTCNKRGSNENTIYLQSQMTLRAKSTCVIFYFSLRIYEWALSQLNSHRVHPCSGRQWLYFLVYNVTLDSPVSLLLLSVSVRCVAPSNTQPTIPSPLTVE